jgi:hypothetical protein
MLTSVKATYDNGQIIWDERPPVHKKTRVVITFLDEDREGPATRQNNVIRLGSMAGKIDIGDDFNDPLDDLKDYM